jgi:hypothetical protein
MAKVSGLPKKRQSLLEKETSWKAVAQEAVIILLTAIAGVLPWLIMFLILYFF